MTEIHLSLISHTNVGKTTLARTLLRRDVGEVRDAAHVTESAEPYGLEEMGEDRLVLWDTPGFGDTARLLRALRQQERPVAWLLAQVWDRFADRPFWSSQQAARHVKEQSDVVLYLINATEDPADAGYVRHELDLLAWIGRPVFLLLNQTGEEDPDVVRRLESDWRRYVALWPSVRGVATLDAFTRSWVDELRLLEELEPMLEEAKRPALARVRGQRRDRAVAVFEASAAAVADLLASAAADREALPDARPRGRDKARAVEALARRLEASTRRLMTELLDRHELAGQWTGEVEKGLEDVLVRSATDWSPQKSALVGGAVSGAVGGLAADVLSGGLTFGGGLVAGAILGALGGAGLSRANELVRIGGDPHVTWSPAFLDELAVQSLLRYLAVAHYGRGRGDYRDRDHPATWALAVRQAVEARSRELRRVWKNAADHTSRALALEIRELLVTVLAQRYPKARAWIGDSEAGAPGPAGLSP